MPKTRRRKENVSASGREKIARAVARRSLTSPWYVQFNPVSRRSKRWGGSLPLPEGDVAGAIRDESEVAP